MSSQSTPPSLRQHRPGLHRNLLGPIESRNLDRLPERIQGLQGGMRSPTCLG